MKLERAKDFNEGTMNALRKKSKVLTCDILLCYSVNWYIKFNIIFKLYVLI